MRKAAVTDPILIVNWRILYAYSVEDTLFSHVSAPSEASPCVVDGSIIPPDQTWLVSKYFLPLVLVLNWYVDRWEGNASPHNGSSRVPSKQPRALKELSKMHS